MSKPYFGRWVREDLRDLIAHQLLFARQSMSVGDVDRASVAISNSFCIQILLSQNTAGSDLVPFDIARKVLTGPDLSLDEALAYADEWINKHGGCIRQDRSRYGRSVSAFIPPNDLSAKDRSRLNKLLENYLVVSDNLSIGTMYISPVSPTSAEPTVALKRVEGADAYVATAWDFDNDKQIGAIVKFQRVSFVAAIAAAIEYSRKLAGAAENERRAT